MVTSYKVGERPPGRFTALIFGDPGEGKTHLIGTAPCDVAVVMCDFTGAETLERFGPALAERGITIEVFEAPTDAMAKAALLQIRNRVEAALRRGEVPPFQLVVVDGLAALEDAIYEEIVGEGGGLVQGRGGSTMLTPAGWGVFGARHLAVRRAALRIPYVHAVFMALERMAGVESTTAKWVEVSLKGQQGARYQADVSYVLRLERAKRSATEEIGWLYFERTPSMKVKARRGDLLGARRIEADLGLIMRKLGYLDAEGHVLGALAGASTEPAAGPAEAPAASAGGEGRTEAAEAQAEAAEAPSGAAAVPAGAAEGRGRRR